MKNKIVRFFSLLLAVVFIAGIAVACSGGADKPPEVTGNGGGNDGKRDDLPKLNFNGEAVKIASREFQWYYKELTVNPDEVVDIVDTAVYKRELAVNNRLGIKLENNLLAGLGKEGYEVVINALRTDINTGDGLYDIGVNNIYHTMGHTTEELFYDLNSFNYINTSKEYYYSQFVKNATIGNKLYAVMGDGTLSAMKFAFATFFNQQVAADMQIGDLYQVVLDGKWTYEYQYNLIRDTWKDIGEQPYAMDDGDTFGLITNTVLGVDPYWSSFNLGILTPNETNGYTITLDLKAAQSKLTSALEKINNLFYNSNGTRILAHESDDNEMTTTGPRLFSQNQTLFATFRLDAVESPFLRDMPSNGYGIIPMPKFDENQKNYYTYVHDLSSVFVVSYGCAPDRHDMVGAAIECFFSESEDVRHQFFEIALKVKYQDDENNSKMLDIIIDHIKLDAGWIYSDAANGIALCLRTLVQAESNNFTSWYTRNQSKFVNSVEDFLTQFEFLDQ
ncbi:MAG: hypothetical protein J5830_03455 [Clostridia bacterium]|nr:hypothetical protein [Clostridia bacterium]